MKKHLFGLGLLALAVLTAAPAFAGRIEPQTIASSGAIDCYTTHLRMGATVGQPATGFSSSSGLRCVAGFWQDFDLGGGGGGCCVGRVGDANGSGEDEPTIGDITAIIDAKFVTGDCAGIITCLPEADINQSGGTGATCEDISIGDITGLIDYLFVTGPSLGLANCP